MITVNTSYTNLVSQHTLARNTNALQKATERLSTGARINHAKDDAAGVFLDVSLSSQISSMKTANDNTLLATNFLNIANGTLTTVSDCLMRMNDLATQACNGVLSDDARNTLQSEMNALSAQIDQSIAASNMNGVSTIDRSNMSADLMNKVDVKSLSELKEAGYVACTAENLVVSANKLFYISSAEELQNLAIATNEGTTTAGRTFTLSNDIDLSSVCSEESGVSWVKIGHYTHNYQNFKGIFDGNGKVIKNLYISDPDSANQGLFGYIKDAEIKNVGIENVNINSAQAYTAGLAGQATESSIISNCYVKGNITGVYSTGGLVGFLKEGSTVKDCYTGCVIEGTSDVGGLIGRSSDALIENSYTSSSVNGEQYVGGLIGWSMTNSIIKNCYATGNVTGSADIVGGLAGALTANTSLTNCHATGKVVGTANKVGGLVGSANHSFVNNCYATGNVEGNVHTGGLVGHFQNLSSMSHSYAAGSVKGTERVGGAVGELAATTVDFCYAKGNVSGSKYIGGFVGVVGATASVGNSYATGDVTGLVTEAGGFAGELYGGSLLNSYATGNVVGENAYYVGGLVAGAWNNPSVTNCYEIGDVTGASLASGIIGNMNSDLNVTNSYASGVVNGVPSDPSDKENFDRSVLDSSLWDLNGDNPTLKLSIWANCGANMTTNRTQIRMQVGDTAGETSSIKYDAHLGLNLDDLDLSTVESARRTLAKLQSNIEDVTAKQSYIGTQINRLSDIYNAQQIRIENTSAAKSTISDTDYAKEVANMVKSQILQQISVSVLTQSQNISGKIALSLL